jgi:hypothetical protein
MKVSNTLEALAFPGYYVCYQERIRLQEACLAEGFDLDAFLFKIWKETLDETY